MKWIEQKRKEENRVENNYIWELNGKESYYNKFTITLFIIIFFNNKNKGVSI